MTAPRRREKPAAGLLLIVLGAFFVRTATAALVVSPATGLAISGFDPIAYFTDAKPESGLAFPERGQPRRLRGAAHPEVYRPAFGGYDPVAIVRERGVPGHPLFWTISGERIYLFYSEQDRADFLANPARVLAAAERNWPAVELSIER